MEGGENDRQQREKVTFRDVTDCRELALLIFEHLF